MPKYTEVTWIKLLLWKTRKVITCRSCELTKFHFIMCANVVTLVFSRRFFFPQFTANKETRVWKSLETLRLYVCVCVCVFNTHSNQMTMNSMASSHYHSEMFYAASIKTINNNKQTKFFLSPKNTFLSLISTSRHPKTHRYNIWWCALIFLSCLEKRIDIFFFFDFVIVSVRAIAHLVLSTMKPSFNLLWIIIIEDSTIKTILFWCRPFFSHGSRSKAEFRFFFPFNRLWTIFSAWFIQLSLGFWNHKIEF